MPHLMRAHGAYESRYAHPFQNPHMPHTHTQTPLHPHTHTLQKKNKLSSHGFDGNRRKKVINQYAEGRYYIVLIWTRKGTTCSLWHTCCGKENEACKPNHILTVTHTHKYTFHQNCTPGVNISTHPTNDIIYVYINLYATIKNLISNWILTT